MTAIASAPGYGARSIFGRAFATYRARFRVLGPMAVLVFSVGGVADAAAQLGADAVARGHTGTWGTALHTGAFLAGAVSSAGVVFYGGLSERIVSEHQHGSPAVAVPELMRSLPWVSLLVADAVITLASVGLASLLLVPGLVALTLLSLTGPVIVSERAGVVRGLGRSAELVRPRFWLTVRVVTIPLLLESAALHGLHVADLPHPFLVGAAYESALGVTIGALVGLAEATFAIDLEGDSSHTVGHSSVSSRLDDPIR
jgi:hypothetical protein